MVLLSWNTRVKNKCFEGTYITALLFTLTPLWVLGEGPKSLELLAASKPKSGDFNERAQLHKILSNQDAGRFEWFLADLKTNMANSREMPSHFFWQNKMSEFTIEISFCEFPMVGHRHSLLSYASDDQAELHRAQGQ